MLHVRNIVCTHQGVRILDGVSFSVAKGSVVGLIGASGSGKSTLLRCIQGLVPLCSGSIESKGVVRLMTQEPQLFPHMTVLENITYIPRKVLKVNHAVATHQAQDLLKSLGLDLKSTHKPHQLSGGQQQRAALVRALSAQPDLLLCDEPTSALDPKAMQDLCEVFRKAVERGITMVIASHDIPFLAQITDRLLVLKQGVIAADLKSDQGHDAPWALEEVLHFFESTPSAAHQA